MSIRCANFMNLEAMRETVATHDSRFGAHDEPPTVVADTQVCVRCFYGWEQGASILHALGVATDDLFSRFEDSVIKMTGNPVKRKCFKEVGK